MLVSFDSVKPFCTTNRAPAPPVPLRFDESLASLAELHVPRLALVGRVDHLQDGQFRGHQKPWTMQRKGSTGWTTKKSGTFAD